MNSWRTVVVGLAIGSSLLLCPVASMTKAAESEPSSPLVLSTGSQDVDPSLQQLFGTWEWRDLSGSRIILVFSPEGHVFLMTTGQEAPALAEELLYTLDTQTEPWQLDLQLSDREKIQTIVQFEAEELKLELAGLHPGQPRPEAFSDQALLFERRDRTPTLPDGVRILSYAERVRRQRENQAVQYLAAIQQAQEYYYQTQAAFTTDWDEFVAGLEPDTPFYRYELTETQAATGVMITAIAKVEDVRSYASVIIASERDGTPQTKSQFCRAVDPEQEMEDLTEQADSRSSELPCPAGYEPFLL